MLKRIVLPILISLLIISLGACASSTPVASGPQGAASHPADPNPSADASTPAPTEPPATQPTSSPASSGSLTYPIVDTGQATCYGDDAAITCPGEGGAFYGQDAQFTSNPPGYTAHGDGTVTDNVTGLMWQQSPDTNGDGDVDPADKLNYTGAIAYCESLTLAGYDDWRLPDIKTLYSLIDFRGTDPSVQVREEDASGLRPFIDAEVFDFSYGDAAAGERIIDAQYASSTPYVATVMGGRQGVFGVNLADGRIKGYPQELQFYVLCTRGNTAYGQNDFVDNGDGTITDNATGLMWAQGDSGSGMTWEEALAWVEQQNAANALGYSDWRLPNAKELQSIVDYTQSPDTTGAAAIDPLFDVSSIVNEAGQTDYPFYWTGTTHVRFGGSGSNAAYVAFGRGLGSMNGTTVIDVHGAGCQRSDPKIGNAADYPTVGHGPQGDVQRVFNYVRLVRGGDGTLTVEGDGAAGRPVDGGDGTPSLEGQPPQEALDACLNLAENAPCTINTPEGEVTGTCALVQEKLACVPPGGPPDLP